jgi:hypothetical protein
MKIEKLTLHGYRGFAALDLDLDPDVTVLVGVNGAGKTSVLDAIALLLSFVPYGVRRGPSSFDGAFPTMRPPDARVGAASSRIEITADIDAERVTWATQSLDPYAPRWSPSKDPFAPSACSGFGRRVTKVPPPCASRTASRSMWSR